jgi:phosphohistidine phosphatase
VPLTLQILRHAKSSRDDPAIADMERPLNARGQRDAGRMGEYMMQNGLVPDRVLCSPALRTRQTWSMAAARMTAPPAATLCPELYDFGDGAALLASLRMKGGDAARLMMITHNPATQALALRLTGSGSKGLRQKLRQKYPTGALAVITFPDGPWADIAEGQGRLESFTRPRDLEPRD